MAFWLVKSEPDDWSFDDQLGVATEPWDGVRNAQAQNAMKKMQKGDLVFFYHSGRQRQIVGLCTVARGAYPDPADEKGRYCLVDLQAIQKADNPVSLDVIKQDGRFDHLALVRQPRLSVMAIDEKSFDLLSDMASMKTF